MARRVKEQLILLFTSEFCWKVSSFPTLESSLIKKNHIASESRQLKRAGKFQIVLVKLFSAEFSGKRSKVSVFMREYFVRFSYKHTRSPRHGLPANALRDSKVVILWKELCDRRAQRSYLAQRVAGRSRTLQECSLKLGRQSSSQQVQRERSRGETGGTLHALA